MPQKQEITFLPDGKANASPPTTLHKYTASFVLYKARMQKSTYRLRPTIEAIRPVSYTHLDVYKRQSFNRSSPKTIGREYSANQGCMQKII